MDFNYINSNYCVFYKIEVVNAQKEKKVIFICKDFEKEMIKDKKCNSTNKFCSRRVKQNINNSNCKIIGCQKFHDIGSLIYNLDYADDYYETEIQKNDNKQLIVLCIAKSSDSNTSKEEKTDKKTSEELKEEADKKLDKAITEAGIGAVEIGMGAVAISQGHV